MISRTTTTTNVLEKFKWKKFKLFLIFILLLQNTLFGMESDEQRAEGYDNGNNRLLEIAKHKSELKLITFVMKTKHHISYVIWTYLNIFDLIKLKRSANVPNWQEELVYLKELFAGDFEAFMDGALDSDLSYLELKIPFTAIDELQSLNLRFTKHVGLTMKHDKHSLDEEYAQGEIHVHCKTNDSEKEYVNKALFYPEHSNNCVLFGNRPESSSLNTYFNICTWDIDYLTLKFRIETEKEDAEKTETKKQIKVEIFGRIFPLCSHEIEFKTNEEDTLLLSSYGHGRSEEGCPTHVWGAHDLWGKRHREYHDEEREIKKIVTQAEAAGIEFKFYFDKDDFEVWDKIYELRSKLYAPEFHLSTLKDEQHNINLELQNLLYEQMKDKVENLDNYVGHFLYPTEVEGMFPFFPDISCSAAVQEIFEYQFYKNFYQRKYQDQFKENKDHNRYRFHGEVPYPNIPTLESFIADQKIAENELYHQTQLYLEQYYQDYPYPNQIYQNPYNANQIHQNPYNANQYYQNSFDQDTFNDPNQNYHNQYNANQIHHNQYNPNQDDQNSFDQPTFNYPHQIYQNQHIPNQDYQ